MQGSLDALLPLARQVQALQLQRARRYMPTLLQELEGMPQPADPLRGMELLVEGLHSSKEAYDHQASLLMLCTALDELLGGEPVPPSLACAEGLPARWAAAQAANLEAMSLVLHACTCMQRAFEALTGY